MYDWYACLHHHVSHHHEATQMKDNHLVTQRRCAYNDNFGVVTEQRYYLLVVKIIRTTAQNKRSVKPTLVLNQKPSFTLS